jgi:hypothetical protein
MNVLEKKVPGGNFFVKTVHNCDTVVITDVRHTHTEECSSIEKAILTADEDYLNFPWQRKYKCLFTRES